MINRDFFQPPWAWSVLYAVAAFQAATGTVCAEKPQPAPEESAREEFPTTPLLSAEFPDEWAFFSGKKDAVLADTWTVQLDPETNQPVIVCKGEPYGYIRTKQRFRNFEFGIEWKFPTDPNGNSGVLLYTNGDDRIWPTSLQVQLHQHEAGSAFPSGGARARNELRDVPSLSKPLNQWNQCLIVSSEGRLLVTINGERVGEIGGCEPQEGSIALQSEGSEIHFRKIWIREIAPPREPGELSLNRRRLRRWENRLGRKGWQTGLSGGTCAGFPWDENEFQGPAAPVAARMIQDNEAAFSTFR